jgi:methylenetetrahydrofolate dehydrogenase (NADP+)/methenyltetrahydrofolate cyclohydrolase
MAIIDGRALAEKIKDSLTSEIHSWQGPRPNLAIILANEREDSKLYVALKEKAAKTVGIDTHLYILDPVHATQAELLKMISFLNNDPEIDGILVQLPLPPQFDTDKIIAAIDPLKDVDGFHPQHPDDVMSPVLGAIKEIFQSLKYDPAGKTAAIIHNSEIFGQTAKDLLAADGAKVILVSPDDPELPQKLLSAEIVVTAVGRPRFLKAEYFNPEALVIDVGTTKENGKVVGDVDLENVKDKVAYITPVPGGIGPMTIALLFRNAVAIYKRRHQA